MTVQITLNVTYDVAETLQSRFNLGEYIDIEAAGTDNYGRQSFRARLVGINLPYEDER